MLDESILLENVLINKLFSSRAYCFNCFYSLAYLIIELFQIEFRNLPLNRWSGTSTKLGSSLWCYWSSLVYSTPVAHSSHTCSINNFTMLLYINIIYVYAHIHIWYNPLMIFQMTKCTFSIDKIFTKIILLQNMKYP